MDGEQIRRDASLEGLLEAGRQAFDAGDRQSAHDLWRAAAVANPYDERVWVSLLEVLTSEEDREVCLKNIIAINPMNPDARRQLRTMRHDQRLQQEAAREAVYTPPVPRQRRVPITPLPKPNDPNVKPVSSPRTLLRAMLTGIMIGLVAVVLGIVVSIIFYGGILSTAVP